MIRKSSILVFALLAALATYHFVNQDKEAGSLLFEPGSQKEDHLLSSESPQKAHVMEVASSRKVSGMQTREERIQKPVRRGVHLNLSGAVIERSPLLEGTGWGLWKGVTALKKIKGVPSDKVLGEVNGFYLIEDISHNDIRQFSPSQPLVVLNSRLGIAGVVTGVVTVTLKEGASIEALAHIDVQVLNSFPEIRTYYVTSSQEVFDLQSFQEALVSESAVERAHLEILSRQYEKN